MHSVVADVRHSLRMLRKHPLLGIVAIASLGLGIGIVTALFSLADAVLLRPLPIRNADAVYRVFSNSAAAPLGYVSYPDCLDLSTAGSLQGAVCYTETQLAVSPAPDAAARVHLALAVTPAFFDVLQVPMAHGRGFLRGDADLRSAIVSHVFWRQHLHGDPSVVGRSIRINNQDISVVGVAPAAFRGFNRFLQEDLYVTLATHEVLTEGARRGELLRRNRRNLSMYVRLKEGVRPAQAQAELARMGQNLAREYLATNQGQRVVLMSELSARMRQAPELPVTTGLLMAVAGVVLLIACSNVASLVLTRDTARARELAVRIAIGAGRRRLIRQLLTDSLLLGLLGGTIGVGLAYAAAQALASISIPSAIPVSVVTRIDLRVLMFAVAVAGATGVVVGLWPAWKLSQPDLASILKDADSDHTTTASQARFRGLLVATQITLATATLVLASVMTVDFQQLMRANPGFRTRGVLVATLDPSLVGYSESRARAFYRELTDRLRALPAVTGVALGQFLPMDFSSSTQSVTVDGFEMAKDQKYLSVLSNRVNDDYFGLMEIPILSGRGLRPTDNPESPRVAVVNEAMATQYWPGRNAVGGIVRIGTATIEVVGIARTIWNRQFGEQPTPMIYYPLSQSFQPRLIVHLAATGDPAQLARPVAAEIRRLDPAQPIVSLAMFEAFLREGPFGGPILLFRLMGGLGAIGFMLALIGLYGTVSHAIAGRTREIGIRSALGATRRTLMTGLARHGLLLSAGGIVGGVVVAKLALAALSLVLPGESAAPVAVILGSVVLVVAATSAIACVIPAWRATQVPVVQALRGE